MIEIDKLIQEMKRYCQSKTINSLNEIEFKGNQCASLLWKHLENWCEENKVKTEKVQE